MLIEYNSKYKILIDKTTYGKIYKYALISISLLLFIGAFKKYMSFIIKYVETITYDTSK